MTHLYRRQPPRGTKVAGSSPLGKGITAHFLFNGSFASAVRGRSGNPVVTGGPYIRSGPGGQFAQGTGSGKIVTDLLPSALGMAGAAPRTVIIEFDMLDANITRCLYSLGDSSARTRSQFTLETNTTYRTIRLSTFNNDVTFTLFGTGGTGARVFLAISYDGGVGVTLNAWSTLNSTGQVIPFSRSFNLTGPLATGDTVPLNIMGGGTYGFTSFNAGIYFLSFYGGRALNLAEIERIRADRHQVMAAPLAFPYSALAAQTPPADTSLAGGASARASAAGALSTAILLAGTSAARVSTAGALTNAGAASGAALAGASAARTSASGALSTSIALTGAAAAVASAYGSMSTVIALRGAAAASASVSGALSSTDVPGQRPDISKIHPSRIVVFGGSGSRVTLFEGSGSRVTPFDGSGSRVTEFG